MVYWFLKNHIEQLFMRISHVGYVMTVRRMFDHNVWKEGSRVDFLS